jgi:Raf kinase inhibitor-like YbhB/YbcL family protein
MRISSSAFRNGEPIPRQYSRNGEDKSPPLQITDVPPNACSLALIMDDPDAPRGTFTHWILFDLDPTIAEIREDYVPESGRQGLNDWGESEYGGPRPPSGEHRYFFKLYALDKKLNLPGGSTRAKIEASMRDHVVAQAEFMGRFAAAQPESVANR